MLRCVSFYLFVLSIVLISSRSVTLALTADEVLKLRAAGVSDETIQLMLQQELDDKVSSETIEQGYATEHLGAWKLKDGRTLRSTGKRQPPPSFPFLDSPPSPYVPEITPYIMLPPPPGPGHFSPDRHP